MPIKSLAELEPKQFAAHVETVIGAAADPVNHSRNDEAAEAPKVVVEDTPTDLRERVLDGFRMALGYADRLQDTATADMMKARLSRSAVRGSWVDGVKSHADALTLLGAIGDWKIIPSTRQQITVLQGSLPRDYANSAFAAYATIREIFRKYGNSGLSTIQVREGKHRDDEFYLCTTLRYPTDTITVLLKSQTVGTEFDMVQQWFAGYDCISKSQINDGDVLVRCGVQIPVLTTPPNGHKHKKPHFGHRRPYTG